MLSKTPAVNTFLGNCNFVRGLVEFVMWGCLIHKTLKFMIYSGTQPRSRERRSFFFSMVLENIRSREKRAFFPIEKDKGTWGWVYEYGTSIIFCARLCGYSWVKSPTFQFCNERDNSFLNFIFLFLQNENKSLFMDLITAFIKRSKQKEYTHQSPMLSWTHFARSKRETSGYHK